MNLKGIIAISGRPGIFKVITQGKNSVIVESMLDKKRFPAHASEKISTLEDISIFTIDEDVKLVEVLAKMLEKYAGKEAPNHKIELPALEKEMGEIVPNYDKDRVYGSDVRKLFQWYNLLLKADLLKSETVVEEGDASDETLKKVKIKKEAVSKKPVSTGAPIKASNKHPNFFKLIATLPAPPGMSVSDSISRIDTGASGDCR